VLYFDASALAKRYVREPETASVRRLLGRGVPATSRLSEVEVTSALGRRWREGTVSADDRDRALARLREDIASMYVVELSAEIAAAACALLLRHPLRAPDAIQLASCLHLAEQLGAPADLVVYDLPLVTAARSEGVRVLQPR
jgi:predicted nucleic acid-binding protein